jgi:hypothetical protein
MLTPLNISTLSWSYTTSDKEKRSAGSISTLSLGIVLKLSYVVSDPDIDEKREYLSMFPSYTFRVITAGCGPASLVRIAIEGF